MPSSRQRKPKADVRPGEWVTYPSPMSNKNVRWGRVVEVVGNLAYIQFIDLFHELAVNPKTGEPMTLRQDLTVIEKQSGPPGWFREGVSLLDKFRDPRKYGHLLPA